MSFPRDISKEKKQMCLVRDMSASPFVGEVVHPPLPLYGWDLRIDCAGRDLKIIF